MALETPIISCTQKIVIYETKARFYVVGSNSTETRFRVLKVDRTEPKELVIVDDKIEYSQKEIRDLLLMIDVGNRSRQPHKELCGLSRTVSAFGIVGFVRFLEGYYIVLITKRRKVALIGTYTIYKIEDTSMVYIPNDGVRYVHPDESRYVKIFQNVGLSSNFYFSYSYDLTHSLQYNLAPSKNLSEHFMPEKPTNLKFWDTEDRAPLVYAAQKSVDEVEDANENIQGFIGIDIETNASKDGADSKMDPSKEKEALREEDFIYGVRNEPTRKYVWNHHMLKKFENHVHYDWILYVTHGFIGQSNISVFGHPVYLTLIARRSNQFAGTRFLKRGANCKGFVANEIETEQIVSDALVTSLHSGRFTSFVQYRGSIPLFWSQDISKMVPKPPITVDQSDPFWHAAGLHFNDVMKRYGAPIIILNLVKKHEKRKHESILTEGLLLSLSYLNQFLPPEHSISYIGFDMARINKGKNANVLVRLAEIAEVCVKKTGFFKSGPDLQCNDIRPNDRWRGMHGVKSGGGRRQHGVVRTNCVDCLDRTNTAQFAVGKCALAFQLYSLGLIDKPCLEFDTDCVRMLEELYEDQGDILALQYGGSQLVHRIKSYRKIAPWTSSSRDIMHTLSRYYSNAFSDAEKQHAINLFLGVFEPDESKPALWEMPTDFYLHNENALGAAKERRSYSQWWELPAIQCLPLPYEQESKGLCKKQVVLKTQKHDERVDGFWDYYKPCEFTSLDELYCCHMPNSIRDFMPKFATEYSPFAVRVRPGRRQEESGSTTTEANPNVTGKDSTMSNASQGSEGSSSSSNSSIDGDFDYPSGWDSDDEDSGFSNVSLKDLFPTMQQTYGVSIEEPDKLSSALYKRYVQIGRNACHKVEKDDIKKPRKETVLIQKSIFPLDSLHDVTPPTVNRKSRDIYKAYVRRGHQGADPPSKANMAIYQNFVKNKYDIQIGPPSNLSSSSLLSYGLQK